WFARLCELGTLQPQYASRHPTCAMPKRKKPEVNADVLKGWQQIATFLGQPVSVAQRWANEGMPVKKQGRYIESSREELNHWLGRESAGEPVQIPSKQDHRRRVFSIQTRRDRLLPSTEQRPPRLLPSR